MMTLAWVALIALSLLAIGFLVYLAYQTFFGVGKKED